MEPKIHWARSMLWKCLYLLSFLVFQDVSFRDFVVVTFFFVLLKFSWCFGISQLKYVCMIDRAREIRRFKWWQCIKNPSLTFFSNTIILYM
jgi:hypothetical protein